MNEIWKKINWIPNLRGTYEVSNLGNVRRTSLIWFDNRKKEYRTIHKIRNLYLYDNGHGYLHVTFPIDTEQGRKLKNFYVHQLVATAFIPNPLNRTEINHKNFVRTDNKVINLEWCTYEENMKHCRSMDKRLKPHYPSTRSKYDNPPRVSDKVSKQKIRRDKKPIEEQNIHLQKGKYYVVRVFYNKKRIYVGCYKTYEEAVKARKNKLKELGIIY